MAFSTEYLTWAPPAPASSWVPDPLSLQLEAALANTDYWLQVALGLIPCGGDCSGDDSFEGVMLGLIHQARDTRVADLRTAPGYDPGRHEQGIAALENAHRLILAAYEHLGHPPIAVNPAWEEAVTGIRQVLAQGLPAAGNGAAETEW